MTQTKFPGITTYPTVHLNGTSGQDLLDQQVEIVGYLSTCLKVMGEATPNGRDYYPQGEAAFQQALLEHLDRVERVKTLIGEVELIAQNVSDQVVARRRK